MTKKEELEFLIKEILKFPDDMFKSTCLDIKADLKEDLEDLKNDIMPSDIIEMTSDLCSGLLAGLRNGDCL